MTRRLPFDLSVLKRPEIASVLRFVVFAALIAYLGYRLWNIGLIDVLSNLPTSPLYYVLFAVSYFVLPVSEAFIYRNLWDVPIPRLFPALIRKRALNEGVVGYSGEAYLFFWARENIGIPATRLLSLIKDNNLISSFVALTATCLLATGVLAIPNGPLFSNVSQSHTVMIGIGAGLVLALIAYFGRRKVLSLDGGVMKSTAAIHASRMSLVLVLQVLQWSAALPSVPWIVWVYITTANLLVTRIPFLPSYNFVLLGLGLSMSKFTGAPDTAVAGLFVTGAALSQIFNLGLFILTAGEKTKAKTV